MEAGRAKWNDLLLPIMLVLAVMPLIIRFKLYDTGYEKYQWASEQTLRADIYGYYRSLFFIAVCGAAFVILIFRIGLYPELTKPVRIAIPLCGYLLMVIASTIGSVHPLASIRGNLERFQTVFVLVAYLILFFYTYQILETKEDYQWLEYGIFAGTVLPGITGIFQIFGQDLLEIPFIQRCIMTKEEYETYAETMEQVFSRRVFLTLYNPNDAAVYLCMLFFFLLILFQKQRKKRYGILAGMVLILIWCTYTRMALVACTVTGIYALGLQEPDKKQIKKTVGIAVGILLLFFVLDFINGSPYRKRLFDTAKDTGLSNIETREDGIWLEYRGKGYLVYLTKEGKVEIGQGEQRIEPEYNEEGDFKLPIDGEIEGHVWENGEESLLNMQIDHSNFQFLKQQEGYVYLNENGKTDQIGPIAAIDCKGLEALGSSRVYIWSRTIPLFPRYLLIGSGPDTYAEAFPQNDYMGKYLYAGGTDRIVEKAHNDLLDRFVQTGGISVVCLIVFLVFYIRKCHRVYRTQKWESKELQMGAGCYLGSISYLVCCIFYDGGLYTTPLFCIFCGIALAAAERKGTVR